MLRRVGTRRSPAPRWLGTVVLLALLVPPMARAHTFEAPAAVSADERGHFRYEAVFTAGPGGARLHSASVYPLRGVWMPVIMLDYLCQHFYEEGEQEVIGVEGDLIDPRRDGATAVDLRTCDPLEFHAETLILPFGATTVPPFARGATPSTWGAIRMLYW